MTWEQEQREEQKWQGGAAPPAGAEEVHSLRASPSVSQTVHPGEQMSKAPGDVCLQAGLGPPHSFCVHECACGRGWK